MAIKLKNLKGDLFGGLTAAVVALPLALAFGVASGIGPIAGLYGAIVLGLFAAIFGGTPTQISGPTGPMTVVMASIVTFFLAKYPETGLALAFTTVMLGGVFQIVLGYFKLGRFINLVPYTVISGFMTGIGLIIILLQIVPFIGSTFSSHSPLSVIQNLPVIFSSINYSTLYLGLPLLVLIFIWPSRLNKYVPSPLFILIIGTVISVLFFSHDAMLRLGDIPRGFPEIHLPVFKLEVLADMLKFGAVLGVLGTIDSLLTSLVADSMTHTEHQSNKELIGQGIGNVFAGLFGGIPGAGATMRTVVNVRAGGTTRLSGVIHSLTMIIIVSIGASLVSLVPQVVLATILLKVGVDIIDWDFLRRLSHAPKSSISITVTVIILTVFVDLITAVGVGIIIASLYTVNRLTHQQLDAVEPVAGNTLGTHLSEKEQQLLGDSLGKVMIYALKGPFSFGAAKDLSKKISVTQDFSVLILDMLQVTFIDTSMSLAIEEIIRSNREAGRIVLLISENKKVNKMLKRLEVMSFLGKHKLVSNRHDAILKAKVLMDERAG